MAQLIFDPQWLAGHLENPEDAATFAALLVAIDGKAATRVFDRLSGSERDRVRVPLFPLALMVAKGWWALLYEPRRLEEEDEDNFFFARHRLDAHLGGFVFPPLAIWSGGEEAVLLDTPRPEQSSVPIARTEFLEPPLTRPMGVARNEVEDALYLLVEATLSRLSARDLAGSELRDAWDRVRHAMGEPEERDFCVTAGRLGLDPYNPDIPDLGEFAAGLSARQFADLCEAAAPDELPQATAWLRQSASTVRTAPPIAIGDFGDLPHADLQQGAWLEGYQAARAVRTRLGLGLPPKRAVERLLDGAASDHAMILNPVQGPVEGLVQRKDGAARVAVMGRTAPQRRFRLCRGAYLAWRAGEAGDGLVTVASTRAQQASRAFAAELLAPAELLRERAGAHGLTQDGLDELAHEFHCDPRVIINQARNHRVPLRGIAFAA
jgi:hypothetical protein